MAAMPSVAMPLWPCGCGFEMANTHAKVPPPPMWPSHCAHTLLLHTTTSRLPMTPTSPHVPHHPPSSHTAHINCSHHCATTLQHPL
eukprot:1144982-Pelagomonas_calceolata.AAC.4